MPVNPRHSININSLDMAHSINLDNHGTKSSSTTAPGKEMPSVSQVKTEMESFTKEKVIKKLKEVGKISAAVFGTGGLALLAVPLLALSILALLTPPAYGGLFKLYEFYGKCYPKIWDWALKKEAETAMDLPK